MWTLWRVRQQSCHPILPRSPFSRSALAMSFLAWRQTRSPSGAASSNRAYRLMVMTLQMLFVIVDKKTAEYMHPLFSVNLWYAMVNISPLHHWLRICIGMNQMLIPQSQNSSESILAIIALLGLLVSISCRLWLLPSGLFCYCADACRWWVNGPL